MEERAVLDMIAAGGVSYVSVRDQIVSGDLLLLHHSFVPSWYGAKIELVQRATGPFAHIAVMDRVQYPDRERVKVYESVTPKVRDVMLSVAAETGFFWISLNKPITPEEREHLLGECGVNDYSQVGAVAAGADWLPGDEASDPRRWCAKYVGLGRAKSGVYLGNRWVPTDMAIRAMNDYNGQLRYVRMM